MAQTNTDNDNIKMDNSDSTAIPTSTPAETTDANASIMSLNFSTITNPSDDANPAQTTGTSTEMTSIISTNDSTTIIQKCDTNQSETITPTLQQQLTSTSSTDNIMDSNNNNNGNSEKPLGLLARAAIMKEQMDLEEKDNEMQQQQQQQSMSSDVKSDVSTGVMKDEPMTTVVIPSSSTTPVAPKAKKNSAVKDKTSQSSSNQTGAITKNKQFTLKQVAKFSEKRLLSTFVEYKKDVKTKRCSYNCRLLSPQQCQQRFESILGSLEAEQCKKDIIEHLRQHLCNLEQTMPTLRFNSCRKIRKKVMTTKTKESKQVVKESENVSSSISSSTITSVTTPTTTATTVATTPVTVTIPPKVPIVNDILKQSIENAKIEEEIYGLMLENNQQQQQQQQQRQYAQQSFIGTPIQYLSNTSLPISTIVVATGHHHPHQQTISLPHHNIEDVPQTVEIITADQINQINQQQQSQSLTGTYTSTAMTTIPVASLANVVPAATVTTTTAVPSTTTATVNASESTMSQNQVRALALDYIEDIRKKSSSAARSVIVNGDKSVIYQCKICPDKQFTSTNGLIFHYKKHAGLKPYVCDLCSSTFTRQHSLNYHMLIHLNKSRFICSECSRQFRHPSHFKEHMRKHSGETPFQCGDCLMKFKTRNTYKRHLLTKHSKVLSSKGIIETSQKTTVPTATTPTVVTTTTTRKIIATKGGQQQTVAGNMTTTAVPGIATIPTQLLGQIVTVGPSTSTIPIIAGTGIPGSEAATTTSVTNTTATKPRRKYGMKFLHKNIETINKYEQQQQQHPQTATLIAANHPSGIPANQLTTASMIADPVTIAAGTLGAAATAQTAPGSNITILRMPQYPSVHILDNGGGVGQAALSGTIVTSIPMTATTATTAIARKTTLLNRCQQQPTQAITLQQATAGQPQRQQQPQQQTLTLLTVGPIGIDSEGKPIYQITSGQSHTQTTADHHHLTSLIPTTFTTSDLIQHEQQQQQQNLTELTSAAIPLTTISGSHHHQLIYHNQQPSQIISIHPSQQQTTLQQTSTITPLSSSSSSSSTQATTMTTIPVTTLTTQSPITPATTKMTTTTNENFLCLLEAIEIKKEEE